MVNLENRMRITRSYAKRRASEAMGDQPQHAQPKKKRVVLGEISSNIIGNPNLPSCSKPRPRVCSTKVTKPIITPLENAPQEDVIGLGKISSVDIDDPQMCEPYVSGIYEYLRNMEQEEKRRPLSNYMLKIQKDVTITMRGILVDWLIDLADEFNVLSDTLYLTISHMDRYLSYKSINRDRLQLLGVTAMLIASKYEEIYPKSVRKFCEMTADTYTEHELIEMEADVLKTLNYEMGNPTVKTFLTRFIRVAQRNPKIPNLQFEFLSYYLAELTLPDYVFLKFLPSKIAAAAIFLAKFTINPKEHPWNLSLQNFTGYKCSDLKECVSRIQVLQLDRTGGCWEAVKTKYKQHKYKCVSTLTSLSDIPASYFE